MKDATKYAPVALFVYNRPEHCRKTLEALRANPEFAHTPLFIFSDGPRQEKDVSLVRATREIINSCSLPNAVLVERDRNHGLADSIISGVTELCARHGRVIVIEDDLLVSPFFLRYMNRALDIYADDTRVMQISGHMFPVELETKMDACFLPFITSWGWATWQRAWRYFDPHMSGFDKLKANRPLRRKFNLNGAYPYFAMLKKQANRKIDSWAIRWYLSVFLRDGFTLYPVRSLVQNIGFDGSGTHCQGVARNSNGQTANSPVESFPEVQMDTECFAQVVSYLARDNSLIRKIERRLGLVLR